MVLLEIAPGREEEALAGYRVRQAQSLRLGALSHDFWKLQEPGEDSDKWMATLTFRDMAHMVEFNAAQAADPEVQATLAEITGPDGPTKILSRRIAEQRT
jgi:hypothetical protein